MDTGGYIEKEKANWRTEFIAEGDAKGIAKGQVEERRDITMRLLQRGIAVEQVAEDTGLSVEKYGSSAASSRAGGCLYGPSA